MIPFRHVLAALALVLSASAGAADIPDIPDAPDPIPSPLTVGLHWLSGHTRGGYEAVTPGLYLRTGQGATVGAYRNSYHHLAAYVGVTQDLRVSPSVTVSLTLGVIAGYREGQVTPGPRGDLTLAPLVAPSILIHDSDGTGARFTFLPPTSPKGAGVVHLSLEWRLP